VSNLPERGKFPIKKFRDTSNIDTSGATEQDRSADFPVRSNLELSHGFQIIRRLPSTRCCGLESPRSAEEAATTIRGGNRQRFRQTFPKKGSKGRPSSLGFGWITAKKQLRNASGLNAGGYTIYCVFVEKKAEIIVVLGGELLYTLRVKFGPPIQVVPAAKICPKKRTFWKKK